MATLTHEQRKDTAVAAALVANPTNLHLKFMKHWWHLTQYGLQCMRVESPLEPVTSTGVLLQAYSKMIFE